MNQVTEEKKSSLTKVFAIVGFVAITVFIVWLAVQIVSFIPGAFSSLASLADSVYNYDEKNELVIETQKSVINAGEAFTVTWSKMRTDGTYAFTYTCTDGVAIDAKNGEGEIVSLTCATPLDVTNVTSLEVLIASEKYRFTDIPYTITFTPKSGAEAKTSSKTITVVNASVPALGEAVKEEVAKPEPVKQTTPAVTTPTKTPTSVAGTPTTIKKIVYSVPVSDPKGKTDLQVTFLGVGTLSGSTFTPKSSIDIDDNGALQFEVKNIGTKTSGEWSYKAELPSDITYTSGDQKALKPNERAVITLGFEGITKTGSETVGVEISTKNDAKESNDEFSKTIKVVD